MTSVRNNNAPRRYFVDAIGRRVLIGLTLEETFEFERLDSEPDAGRTEAILIERSSQRIPSEQRWLELYSKHENAWKAWMARSRIDSPYV
ncbi:hypothetical protein L6654_33250 [Bradyrhizobium sp. WYCCWR 13023]|uniref:Uncharacterized protein n=1 Tax=Bradyrhizobium zhengyangense TaxID=2911009 RepID=A0A9X1RF97_9BRAD|nr:MULTISPECIES: hypothetical protein [Bradyrhizobium]MCG2631506.1 hypothetical protein [Bradyrhizobium zhengyangense]MCG2671366.1 hypothetical protein [Bradyrhizobium zhengyangense]MDA9522861.1 hypothetical protein [Bradyrhizobium sp. CCBAU 11434]